MAEAGGSTAVAFDQIDKAPEERARGITIATAHGRTVSRILLRHPALWCKHAAQVQQSLRYMRRDLPSCGSRHECPFLHLQSSTRQRSGIMPTWTVPVTPIM